MDDTIQQDDDDQLQMQTTDIFGQIGLDNISNSEKLALMEVFGAEFADMLAQEVESRLTPEEQAQLDKLDEEGDENKINQFLTEQVKDFDVCYNKALQRFLAQTHADVKDARAMIEKTLNEVVKQ